MKITTSLVGLALAMGLIAGQGCSSESALSKLEGFSKRMCTCPDRACVDQVNDELVDWMRANASTADPGDKDKQRASDLVAKMEECANKFAGSSAKGVDDSAHDPASPTP